jgi:hypothetical protein
MKPIELDDIPAPGEPLQPKIHEHNQQLLEEEIAERKERLKAKLGWWELRKTERQYNNLRAKLNQANYSAIYKRWLETKNRLLSLGYRKENEADPSQRERLQRKINLGSKLEAGLDKQLQDLLPLASEFEMVWLKLSAHRRAVAWEKEDAENEAAFRREAVTWEHQIIGIFKQSARLHHAGVDSKGKKFIKVPQIERTIFLADRVLYQIKTTRQTPFQKLLGRWSSALPYNVDISALTCEDTLLNMSAACNRLVTVERAKIGTNLYYSISRLDAADGIPKRYPYHKIKDWYPTEEHSKTPWAAGVTENRKVQFYNFEDHPHVLIAGTTLSGKSNHVNQMISLMVEMNTPAELRLQLIDMKGGIEFTHWNGIKHAFGPMIKDQHEVLPALRYLRSIMERRLATFTEIGAKNLASFNEKSEQRLPRIICIVDEMATLIGLGDLTADIHYELRVLSSQGRAAGIHLVLCTQHPSVDVLPGWVKTNMGVRVAGKFPSHQGSMVILDSVTAATLPDLPGRMVFSIGRNEVIAQSPYISDEEIARALAVSKEFPTPDETEFVIARPKARPVFTAENAIEIAITKLGGKLSRDRIMDVIGLGIITETKLEIMIDDIIDRKEVIFQDVKYVVRKIRRAHILEPVGQSGNSEVSGVTDKPHPAGTPIDGIGEIRPIEEAIAS